MEYKYACGKCSAVFEFEATEQEMAGELQVFCPSCKSGETVRVFSIAPGNKTGTYVYSREMRRLVKVSDRASIRSKGGCAPQAGPGCCGN